MFILPSFQEVVSFTFTQNYLYYCPAPDFLEAAEFTTLSSLRAICSETQCLVDFSIVISELKQRVCFVQIFPRGDSSAKLAEIHGSSFIKYEPSFFLRRCSLPSSAG
jgi:hypothetical protein